VVKGGRRTAHPIALQCNSSSGLGGLAAAVLIEMGYLTNAQQEKQLSAGDFQNTFVQSIADAITRYRDAMGGAK